MFKAGQPHAGSLPAAEALSHADALYNLARYLTKNPADAEDLVQDTYARAFGNAAQFKTGSNLKAWLFSILRHAFIDASRRRRARPLHASWEDSDYQDTVAFEPEAAFGDAELERLRHLVAQDIERALLKLPEALRAIVLLDLEGFNESELSQILNCALGTVKSRLARARSALRGHLREYAE